MRQIVVLMCALLSAWMMWWERASFRVRAEKGVEKIIYVSSEELMVYCYTGICSFIVEANVPVDLLISMYYAEQKPFTKIEGAYSLGEKKREYRVVSNHQILVNLEGSEEIEHLQVVSYFLN